MLKVILSDFTDNSIDLTEIKLTNWIFSIDYTKLQPDICFQFLQDNAKILNDAAEKFLEGTLTDSQIRTDLYNSITSYIVEAFSTALTDEE